MNESVSAGPAAVDPLERSAIDAIQHGAHEPYDYLVSRYMKRVLSIAWGIVRDAPQAEDLAQEAFVKAFESIGRFRRGEPFGPWIFRIVTNLSLDVIKHRKRFPHEEITDRHAASRADNAEVRAVSGEIASRIDAAIEALPGMQRVVARLFLVEGFNHREIAAMTRLREGTVRSHLSLARKRLREDLSDLAGADHE